MRNRSGFSIGVHPRSSAAIIALLLCVGLLRAQGPPQDSSFFLRGGTVHTIAGPLIENGSIIVGVGKIIGVGKNLTPPAGMRVIDITGQHVYPGMIDSASMVGANREEPEPSVVAKRGHVNPQAVAVNGVHPDSE